MKIKEIEEATQQLQELKKITKTTYEEIADCIFEPTSSVRILIKDGKGQLKLYLLIKTYLEDKKKKMKKGGLI